MDGQQHLITIDHSAILLRYGHRYGEMPFTRPLAKLKPEQRDENDSFRFDTVKTITYSTYSQLVDTLKEEFKDRLSQDFTITSKALSINPQ